MFVNVAGGVRVDEPGADLAVALALASAHRGEPLRDADGRPLACFGEIGLTGELRGVAHADRRVAEALEVRPRPRSWAPPPPNAPRASTQAATLRDAAHGAQGCDTAARGCVAPRPARAPVDKRESDLSTTGLTVSRPRSSFVIIVR